VCSRKRTIRILAAIVLTSFAINIHFLIGFDTRKVANAVNDDVTIECEPTGETYLWFVQRVWAPLDFVLYSLIPFIILAVGGVVIAVKLSQPRSVLRGVNGQAHGPTHITAMSKLTVLLSVVYITCSAPLTIFLMLTSLVYGNAGDLFLHSDSVFGCVYIIWMCNNAVNFLLYFFTGSRFRQAFKAMFIKTRHRVPVYTTEAFNQNTAQRMISSYL